MSWTAPRTWVAGEIVTAALLNTHLRDDLLFIDPTMGSWTPALIGAGGSTASSYSVQIGRYIRFGRAVFFEGRITLTAKGTLTGAIEIDGLPTAADATLTGLNGVTVIPYWSGMTTSVLWLGGYVEIGTTHIVLTQRITAGVATANLAAADLSNTSDFSFGGLFFTAAA